MCILQQRIHFPPGLIAGLLLLMACNGFSCWLLWVKTIWLGMNVKTQTDSCCSGGENCYHFKCHSAWCMIKGTMRYLLSRQGADAEGKSASPAWHTALSSWMPVIPPAAFPSTPKKLEAFSFNNRRHLSLLGCWLLITWCFPHWKIWLKSFIDK